MPRSQSVTDGGLLALLARQTRALQLRTAPALAFCRDVAVPTVVGILRPTILLPLSTAARLALHDVEVILAHELAHIRRHDHLVNLFQRMIEAFLFFHPAVWWLSRRIRAERENCCDDLVVSLGVPPLSYATSLLHLAELSQAAAPGSLAVVGLYALRDPSQLRRRVARLLGADQQPPVRLVRAWPLAATLLLAVAFTISAFVSPGTGQVTEPSAIPTEPSSAAPGPGRRRSAGSYPHRGSRHRRTGPQPGHGQTTDAVCSAQGPDASGRVEERRRSSHRPARNALRRFGGAALAREECVGPFCPRTLPL